MRAIWRNKKFIKEYENDKNHDMNRENKEEVYEFTNHDIIAMIIAMYQLIMPIIIIGVLVFIVLVLFM